MRDDDNIPPAEADEFSRAFNLYCTLDEAKATAARFRAAADVTTGLECEANIRLAEAAEAEGASIEAELAALKASRPGEDAPTEPDGAPEIMPKSDDHDAKLVALFDSVRVATLESLFPAGDRWTKFAERAARNGLQDARTARGLFNPYLAARWWIDTQAPAGWKWERCARVLANNLPARSRDSRYLLTGDFD